MRGHRKPGAVPESAARAPAVTFHATRFAIGARKPSSPRLLAMGTDTQPTSGHGDASIDLELASVSVALLLEALDPRIVNPRYLRRKQVVPGGFVPDAQRTYANSESALIAYGASHQVSADRGTLTFTQFGTRMAPEEIDVPGIASKFLGAIDDAYCTGFGIVFCGFVAGATLSDEAAADLFRTDAPHTRPGIPRMEVNITCPCEDKVVFLNASDFTWVEEGAQREGVLYRATYHRETPDSDPGVWAGEKLAAWEDELGEFCSLSKKFSVRIRG